MKNLAPLSVSALTEQIRSLLEATFMEVCCEGEVSNLTLHASGHLYFTMKDEKSTIRCVMFKNYVKSLRFTPQQGMHLIVRGVLNVYVPRGEYQITCHSLEEVGQGSLNDKYEALKKKLESKGYFDPSRKKPLPPFPKRIALLTSLSGAALQDMKKVAARRWNLSRLIAFETLTQGRGASESIARNIAYVDSLYGREDAFDIIVIGRGGGSMEDLWGFNEECVADAIYRARTPIVSAVGHEVDFLISDFVADLRAPTPSACMEMILPDKREWLLRLDDIRNAYAKHARESIARAERAYKHLLELYQHTNYESTLSLATEQITQLKERLDSAIQHRWRERATTLATLRLRYRELPLLREKEYALQTLIKELQANHPKRLLREHYAQILHHDKPTSLASLCQGEEIELCDGNILARAKILSLQDLTQEGAQEPQDPARESTAHTAQEPPSVPKDT